MPSVGKDDREMEIPGNVFKALVNEIIHMFLSTGQISGSQSMVQGSLRVPETLSEITKSKLFDNEKRYLPSSFSFSHKCTVKLSKGWTFVAS